MRKETKDKHFIKKPEYPGGLKAMREFIRKEMKYPKLALEKKIEGTVYLRYEVNHKGQVTGSKILSSLGHGCDEEAQRILSKMKFTVGKNPYRMKVKFNKTIKIHFHLPKIKPAPQSKTQTNRPAKSTSFSYTVTTKNSNKAAPEKKKSGYSYTIKY